MMQDDSFEEFVELVSSFLRQQEAFTVIGKLAAKDSFRQMFRQLLRDGWLLPREDDSDTLEMMKVLHAEFAYQEGNGPKPLCVFDEDQHFLNLFEEDEFVFQSMSLHEPDSNTDEQIENFFAKHPGATWKQASEALSMSVQSLKRQRKKAQSSASTASGNFVTTGVASREHQETRELKLSMSMEALQHSAYTKITFASGTSAIFIFSPAERGRVLWSERAVSHPVPATPAGMDSMLRSKWAAFSKSGMY
jgi:hypothetical protein